MTDPPDEALNNILDDMDLVLEKMVERGVTVDPFWTSNPEKDPKGWTDWVPGAVRYIAKNEPMSKDLTDGALGDWLERLESIGYVKLENIGGEKYWKLTPAGRDLAIVAEVMDS